MERMNLRNLRGFFVFEKWFVNSPGSGHEKNAMDIIRRYRKLYPEENWNWRVLSDSAADFLILEKRAIQLASGSDANCLLYGSKFFTENQIKDFMERNNLLGYRIFAFSHYGG